MKKFAQLFAGRTDHYGIYFVREKQENGKQKGQGKTIHEPLTDAVWEAHLSGKRMLGIVPIRTDGTVNWFAGDIDKYDLDLVQLERLRAEKKIPVVICRSKSGGAHLYAFVAEAIPAALARKLMAGWLADLGYPKAEVFPKQDTIVEGATGNWINLPYFGGDNTDRYAFDDKGKRFSLAEFERAAHAVTIRPQDMREYVQSKPKPGTPKDPWKEAPPCVERMKNEGVTSGSRNRAALQAGIYFNKAFPDDWEGKWTQFCGQVMEPGLELEEMGDLKKKIAKEKYQYLCGDEPMCSLCNKDECLTRKWGVGPQQGIEYAEVVIDRLIKIASDPPVYYLVCNGKSVKMATDQLLSPEKARRRIYEMTGLLMSKLKPNKWEDLIQKLPTEVVEAPAEVNLEGQVQEAFREWVFNLAPRAPDVDSVARGNPFFDAERRRIVFRGQDFIGSFKRTRRKEAADRDIWAALNDMGCKRENIKIKGKQTKCWCYPVDDIWFTVPGAEGF